MNSTEIRTEKIAEPLAEKLGLLIYDVEFKKEGPDMVLRVFIDRENSNVSIDDCENMSRPLKELLDGEGIDYSYLEVSSPGIERLLKKQRDFDRFKGEKITVSLFEPVAGSKKAEGILKDRDENFLTVICGGEDVKIDNKKIAWVRLCVDF